MNEEILINKKRKNMKIFYIHRMINFDLLFYYAIKFLFLNNIKGFSAKDIIITSAFWGLFKALSQIPSTIFVDKFGNKKGLIIADFMNALSVLLIMFSNNLSILILANLIGAGGYALKELSEANLLNSSIVEEEITTKNKIFAKKDGKAVRNYFFIEAISSILAGILFEINGYIPMIICTLISIFSAIYSFNIEEVKEIKEKSDIPIIKRAKNYFKNLSLAFKFILNSERLRALMLYSGIMYGIIMVMGTYEMGLLEDVGISAIGTGIIYAVMKIISSFSSSKFNEFHKKNKNRSLALIAISYTLACLFAGIISVSNISNNIIIIILLITYAIRYLDNGLYQVLIKKYIMNFTNEEVFNKVCSANGMVTGIGNFIICLAASFIASMNNIRNSIIIFGIVFFIIIVFVLKYMSSRLGLKPEEYKKKDIDYKEYINMK